MKSKKWLICTLMISLLIPARLAAGGNPEVGLPKVDRLIKERNYNDAIIELANYMNEHPEDFDGAQRRIRKILVMREDYNDTALDLIDVLINDPANDAEKVAKIQYLESLEKNPNKPTQDFIRSTKEASQFTLYRSQFTEIMTTGNALIDQNLTVDAARKFASGLSSFYKFEFDEENPEELVSKVNASLGGITAAIGNLSLSLPGLDAALAACEAAILSGNIPASESSLALLDVEMNKVIALRNQIAQYGWLLEDTYADAVQTKTLLTENSYLPFAWRFSLGRKSAGRFEGVLGAFDSRINRDMDRIEGAFGQILRSSWGSAYVRFEEGNLESGLAGLATATRFTALGSTFALTGQRLVVRPDTWGVRPYRQHADNFAHIATIFAGMGDLAAQYTTWVNLSARLTAYAPEEPASDAIRKQPSRTVAAYNGFASELAALAARNAAVAGTIAALPVSEPYTAEITAFRQKLTDFVAGAELSVVRNSSSYQDRSAALTVGEWQKVNAEALRLLGGVTAEGGTTQYFPAESVDLFTKLRSGIAADRKSILIAVDLLGRNRASVTADASVSASVQGLNRTVAALDALYASATDPLARASSRVELARAARQDFTRNYGQAQSALTRTEFQRARDSLQRAREKANESLAIQESASLRAESDRLIEALGAEITRVENQAVVREVRNYISTGKNLYYIGDFEQSELVFTQAKARWGVTNIEPNPEVENWLRIINIALSMKTGRTIPITDPLYPEMSQILSRANTLFEEGKKLMSAGRKAEAVTILASAKEEIRQLKLVYASNQDAGQLSLRIDQLLDREEFDRNFKLNVEHIRQNYRNNPQTSYTDLLDLYQIYPAYPGLKALLQEIEYDLGIKIRPPDPAELRESVRLTNVAQKTYDANARLQFPDALVQLDEAIKLNPDNQRAIALKDRIQTAIGGKAVVVLSAEDEAKYLQAVSALQKLDKITANALVQQLLQNPKNRNSAKILELEKRIGVLQ